LLEISTYLPFGLVGLSSGSSLSSRLLLSSDTSILELSTMSLLGSNSRGRQANTIQLVFSLDTGTKVENNRVTDEIYNSMF
jgi:hypothetical protein